MVNDGRSTRLAGLGRACRRLAACAVALASVELAARAAPADASAAMDGAFGVGFGRMAPVDWIVDGGTGPLTEPLPPAPFTATEPPSRDGLGPTWQQFRAPRMPRLFADRGLVVAVHVRTATSGEVVRILATATTNACPALSVEVDAQLKRRYRPRAPAGGIYYYNGEGEDDRIQLGCHGGVLFIDYCDGDRYARWQSDRQHAVDAYDAAARVALAEQFGDGDEHGLRQVLGLPLRQPLEFPGAVADVVFQVVPPLPLRAWSGASYELTLAPDRTLVRLSLSIALPSGAAARAHGELRDALVERFGPLVKDTATHVVLTLNGDHVVVRRLATSLAVTFIDGKAYEAHRQRLVVRQQLAEAYKKRYLDALADGF